jgi:aminopeptidase N
MVMNDSAPRVAAWRPGRRMRSLRVVPALTESEAQARSALIDVESCEVFLDLTTDPPRSRTTIRFRCSEPGASAFADLNAPVTRSAVLNGGRLDAPADGRLALPRLAAANVLTAEAEISPLSTFADPADGATYLHVNTFPADAPDFFCCFDQQDMTGAMTLSVAAPAGWECFANGAVAQRPPDGEAGVWRFETVPRMRPLEFALCCGPYAGLELDAGPVRMSVRCRSTLSGRTAELERFGELARQAVKDHESTLKVSCPYKKYDIAFVPDVQALGVSVPGLMLANERLLDRISDPDDRFIALLVKHEVAHLWFGCLVGVHWWDDLWLDEAMASYMECATDADWAAFSIREKDDAYRLDAVPGTLPVSSPVATAAEALVRPYAITYIKGAAVVRQLDALIGRQAVIAGLTDYLTRYAARGTGRLEDLVACWSRAAGRDLSGWADDWLRTPGTPTLRAELETGPDGTIGSLAVAQDLPRTHRTGIGLYDLSGSRLRRRRLVSAEIAGARTEIPELAGEPVPDALILNDGDRAVARVSFDERTFRALASTAMETGDPLTDVMCWNTAWDMVASGELAAEEFAALVITRLARSGFPPRALEVLLERAVTAADLYAPRPSRAAIRERLAGAIHDTERAGAPVSDRRALDTGFAASAQSTPQLEVLRTWLTASPAGPDGPAAAALRAKILETLSARGLATDAELDAMAAADPVAGTVNLASCRAMRPDPAAKEAAWTAALGADTDWQLARAHARGVWVPGQEDLMAGYRDRYFAEAVPTLNARDSRATRRLAEMLFPMLLADDATLAATRAALEAGGLTGAFRATLVEREAMLRAVATARSASSPGGVSGNPQER